MRDREPLAQADRHIAECKNRIVRQREVIANAFQRGHDTNVAVSMLRALEASLRSFSGASPIHPGSAKKGGAAMIAKNQ